MIKFERAKSRAVHKKSVPDIVGPINAHSLWQSLLFPCLRNSTQCSYIRKGNVHSLQYLKSHKFVIWFRCPCVNLDSVLNSNGQELYSMEVYCNCKNETWILETLALQREESYYCMGRTWSAWIVAGIVFGGRGKHHECIAHRWSRYGYVWNYLQNICAQSKFILLITLKII